LALSVKADELLYRYDCDVLPYDPAGGWQRYDRCEISACIESLENGHFILQWPPNRADFANYHHQITPVGETPPASLWVEWRFRSDTPFPPTSPGCDGGLTIGYDRLGETVYMHGDAAVSFEGGQFVLGLALNEFHTYRLESPDGLNYRVSVNGFVFIVDQGTGLGGFGAYLQLQGDGGCSRPDTAGMRNEWDYVRYGTIAGGEAIVSSHPPAGILDAAQYPNPDRFTVTFDLPNYVYVADISVDVMSAGTKGAGTALTLGVPILTATRRQDNGPPETVEIVLDRPLAVGTTTRFTFNTGGTPNTVEYTLVDLSPCCFPSGTCTELASSDCSTQGGTPISPACEGDADSDGRDGTCGDACPTDPTKFAAGQCGCGVPDTDSDSDTVADCLDQCPTDPAKLAPGQCGCGVPDADTDSDTIADCLDQCPGRDDRIDADADGLPDCLAPIIPASSVWGLVILALLLTIVAKVALRPARG
jgi:hypothetical protein